MIKLFSETYPTMRLVWDATTIDAMMKDPLAYYWKYVLGYRQRVQSIDLEWGTAWDKAMEFYHVTRRGYERREALLLTIEKAIARAEETDLDVLAAEAPKAKANKKNLSTLIRSIVWYDREWGDYPFYEPLPSINTVLFDELFTLPTGEPITVVANFDQLARSKETDKMVVIERKSTVNTISAFYWQQYDPSTQINTYDWMAHRHFATEGVWVEACQTAVGFSRFSYHECWRTQDQRDHWGRVMKFWINLSFELAKEARWSDAMNLGTQKWENAIRNIERRPPGIWDNLLRAEFEKQPVWNPMHIN